MEKIGLGQTITILANIGVIAGIAFLAVELRQNNQLMEGEARAARNIRLSEQPAMVSTNGDLADLLVRAKNGETLSESEEVRVITFNVLRLRGQEAYFLEFQAGTVETIPLDQWRVRFDADLFGAPPQSETWNRTKRYLTYDFVQFIENEIIGR